MATERLQKVLARAGVSSRRAAEELIVAGRVRVNGRVVSELGAKADVFKDRVEVDGRRLVAEAPVYLAVHKPRGVVSTMSDPEGRPSMKELLTDAPARVFPVGRLDFATSGIILATNDGGFSDGLLHPKRAVPKTYVLKVNGVMEEKDVERWRRGVQLEDGMTRPAEAKVIRHEEGKTWLELTISEGRNQQIRRMGDATGFRVMRLARMSFAGVSSEGLRPGKWRLLTRDELLTLKQTYGVPEKVPGAASIADKAQRVYEGKRPQRPFAPRGASPSRGRAEHGKPPYDKAPREKSAHGKTAHGKPTRGRSAHQKGSHEEPAYGRAEQARGEHPSRERGGREQATSERGRPSAGRPQRGRPNVGRPNVGRPNVGRPQPARPESGRSERGARAPRGRSR